jgi:hypothetical protein
MTEETNVQEVIEEIRNADEETLRDTIQKWFESTRTEGMKIGAKFISAGIFGAIQKHTKKPGKVSLRDYERMTADIIKIIAVQLTEQNDSVEENENDGTTE